MLYFRSGGMTYTLTSDNGIYLLATMIKSLRGIVRLNSQEVSETLHMNRVSKLPGTQVKIIFKYLSCY